MTPKTHFSQNPNDGFFEFHESHFEKSVPEPVDGETFFEWHTQKLLRLRSSGQSAKAHIFAQCRFKIIQYSIQQTSMGFELEDFQLIHRCEQLFSNYCWNYRLT